MKTDSVLCECGSKMFRVRAQSGKGDIQIGYYCPGCLALQNTKREYLVPMDLITRMDPFFLRVSKREAYLAILKTGGGPEYGGPVVTHEMINNARDKVGSTLKPFCRPDRQKFVDEMKNDFIKNVLPQKTE